jgi:hypothetical protein
MESLNMCQFKSAIILKDHVYISKVSESHTTMLEELKIEDNQRNAEKRFVRAELVPLNNDVFSDIDTWKFVVDQDIIPEWFVKEYEETRIREAVKLWAKDHIFIGVDDLRLSEGMFYLKDCKNSHCSNTTSEHYGNATSEHYDNATSKHYSNATSKHWGNTTSEHYDNATSKHYSNATSKHWGNTTSEHYDNATSKHCSNTTSKHYGNATSKHWGFSVSCLPEYSSVEHESIILMENSTLKDCKEKTIYQSGDWKLVLV